MQEQQETNQIAKSMVLVFDTEATGMVAFKLPSDDPVQPHVVEVAALLFTEGGVLVDSFECLVRPDGWESTPEALAVHGITHEEALAKGIPEKDAILQFLNLHSFADVRVAHNCGYDDRVIRSGIKRYLDEETAEAFKAAPTACTALLAKPICQLPPTEKMKATNFKNSFKTPNLSEALFHFTGEHHDNGHRARADAMACARIYFAMKGVRMPDYPNDLDFLGTGIDSEGGSHD